MVGWRWFVGWVAVLFTWGNNMFGDGRKGRKGEGSCGAESTVRLPFALSVVFGLVGSIVI